MFNVYWINGLINAWMDRVQPLFRNSVRRWSKGKVGIHHTQKKLPLIWSACETILTYFNHIEDLKNNLTKKFMINHTELVSKSIVLRLILYTYVSCFRMTCILYYILLMYNKTLTCNTFILFFIWFFIIL